MIILRNKNYSGEGDLVKAGALLTVPVAIGGAAWLAKKFRENQPSNPDILSSYNLDKEEAHYRSLVGDTGKLLQTNNPQLYNKIKSQLPDNYVTGTRYRYPSFTYRRLGKEGYNTYGNGRPADFHIIGENENGALIVNPNVKNGELYNYDADTGRLVKTTLEKWKSKL